MLALVFGVEPLAQLLAALEEGDVFGAHVNRLTGARVAAGARVAGTDRQGAEAAQLDTAAFFQRLDHPLQDHAYDTLDVALREVRVLLRKFRDELGLDHERPLNRRDHRRKAAGGSRRKRG